MKENTTNIKSMMKRKSNCIWQSGYLFHLLCMAGLLITPTSAVALGYVHGNLSSVRAAVQDGKKINGKVSDANGEPLIGATVMVKGSTIATVTDMEGNFQLDVPNGATLVISYVGYNQQEFKVGSQRSYNFKLDEDSNTLNELVVIGYGQVKKKDLTGSVTAINRDDLNKGVQNTAQEALVGKIAGVNVITNSGAPGAGSTIRIRSGASLSASNDPLIVIDGVPVDNSTIEGGGNVLGGINPNDIETFTVLKDASATAIYGSRASNGVIVITTKKGSEGGIKVNYNGNVSVGVIAKRLTPLTADEFRSFVPTVTGVPAGVSFGTAKAKFLCNSLIMSRYKIENKKRVTNWLLLKFPELP